GVGGGEVSVGVWEGERGGHGRSTASSPYAPTVTNTTARLSSSSSATSWSTNAPTPHRGNSCRHPIFLASRRVPDVWQQPTGSAGGDTCSRLHPCPLRAVCHRAARRPGRRRGEGGKAGPWRHHPRHATVPAR